MVSDRFYATVRALSLPFLKAWIRLHVHGLENLPAQGAVLMVANHTSYLDPAVLGRASPRKVHFFIKRSVWGQPGMHWFFRGMDSIPTSEDPADTAGLRAGLRHLAAGTVVGVFPEGGRTTDGKPGAAKTGVALLAARTGCPVVAVGITGAFLSLPTGSMIPRPRRIDVRFGEPFTLAPGRGREELEAAVMLMQRQVAALLESPLQGGSVGS